MARFNVWLRAYVLSIVKSPKSRSKNKKDMSISPPIPGSMEHTTPVPYLPRSISAQDLPSQHFSGHARHNSADRPRPLTIHIREPSTQMPPDSFPTDLPPRSLPTSPTSPDSKRLSKRFSQLSTTTRDIITTHNEKPRPVSYFSPGLDISIADLMPLADGVNQTTTREAKRMSHISIMNRIEDDERRMSKRLSKRMSTGFDMYRSPTKQYAEL